MMGRGKSVHLIEKIKRIAHHDRGQRFLTDGAHISTKFVVVVPLLSEVDRYMAALPELDFRDPQPIDNRKYWGLKKLIEGGRKEIR
jgi:hypothetical protein